jgi:hypothetical protein
MVQVLPYVPSFGEQALPALGNVIGSAIGQHYANKKKESTKAKDTELYEQLQNPELSPIQRIALVGKMSPESQKTVSSLLAPLLKEQEKGAQRKSLLQGVGVLPGMGGGQQAAEPSQQTFAPQQQEPPQQEAQEQPLQPRPKLFPQFSDEDLYQLTLDPTTRPFAENALEQRRYEEKLLHDEELEKRKETAKIRAEERALGNEKAKKYLEHIETDRLKLPDEEFAVETIIGAIKSKELNPFSQAHFGEMFAALGAPEAFVRLFATPESQAFKTGLKTFIGNTVKEAFRGTTNTAELKLVEDMLAKVGQSEEANLAAGFALQAAVEMKKLRISITDQYLEAGVPPSKVAAVAEKALEPLRRQIKDEYFEALRELSGGSGGK